MSDIAPAPRPSGGQLAAPAHAADARRSAALRRAEHLMAVTDGMLSIADVVEAACQPGNKALLRITLHQLLLSQPGWGEVRTSATLQRLLTLLGLRLDPARTRRLPVAWLVDPRAAGTRLLAWLDATNPQMAAPWPGYPFTPPPNLCRPADQEQP